MKKLGKNSGGAGFWGRREGGSLTAIIGRKLGSNIVLKKLLVVGHFCDKAGQ